jgi:hypothetical protein
MSNPNIREISKATRWPPGQSGNPNGLPVGSRNAFSNAFMEDLAGVWAQHGRSAMELTAKTMPSVFFATAARVLPKDVAITLEQSTWCALDAHGRSRFQLLAERPQRESNRRCFELALSIDQTSAAHRRTEWLTMPTATWCSLAPSGRTANANECHRKPASLRKPKRGRKTLRYTGAILLSVCGLPEKGLESPNRKRPLLCA